MNPYRELIVRIIEQNARNMGGLGIDYDYGLMRGLDSRGHGSDAGKLPNHPTFSDESFYASKNYPGGHWSKDFQGDVFRPSVRQAQTFSPEFYINEYFPYAEAGRKVRLDLTNYWDIAEVAPKKKKKKKK